VPADNPVGLAPIDTNYIQNLPFRSTTGDVTKDGAVNDILLRIARLYSFPIGQWPAFKYLAPGSQTGKRAFARFPV
ncbi:hypothetical protein, partial [Mycobacterium tuberculosis]|uniref:hypothetical protein n=1 Tax=Mycobacterium tuberculosis TaxID=1773 RepID=UPI001BE4915D